MCYCKLPCPRNSGLMIQLKKLSALKVFKTTFPCGFALEILHVYSGLPVIVYKFRHWGFMEGPFKGNSPTREMVEFFGMGIFEVPVLIPYIQLPVLLSFFLHPTNTILIIGLVLKLWSWNNWMRTPRLWRCSSSTTLDNYLKAFWRENHQMNIRLRHFLLAHFCYSRVT